jgi:hypothetical protein
MKDIGEGKITAKESKIGIQFNALKDLGEASYIELIKEYKKIQNNG